MEQPDVFQLQGLDLARQVMREIYQSNEDPPADLDQDAGEVPLPFDPTWAIDVNHEINSAVKMIAGHNPGAETAINLALENLDKELAGRIERLVSDELITAELDLRVALLRWRELKNYYPNATLESG